MVEAHYSNFYQVSKFWTRRTVCEGGEALCLQIKCKILRHPHSFRCPVKARPWTDVSQEAELPTYCPIPSFWAEIWKQSQVSERRNLDGSWRNSLSRNKRADNEAMPSFGGFIIDWLIDNYPKAPQPSIWGGSQATLGAFHSSQSTSRNLGDERLLYLQWMNLSNCSHSSCRLACKTWTGGGEVGCRDGVGLGGWTALAGCSCSSCFLSWRPMPRISDAVCTDILNQCWCGERIFAKTTLQILSVQGDWGRPSIRQSSFATFLPYMMQVWLDERKTSLAHKIGEIVFDSRDDNQQMFWTALLARG